VWPPAGATAVDLAGFHERLTEAGFAYGPAFRGLRAAWRHGDEVFAEVALPDGVDTAGYGLHPALLDAAVQVTALAGLAGVIPFSWSGVTLHASGASVIRVRLTPVGDHAVAIAVADAEGTPVASVDSLMLRPVRGDELAAARRGDLLRMKWVPAALTAAAADPPLMLAAGTEDLSGIGVGTGRGCPAWWQSRWAGQPRRAVRARCRPWCARRRRGVLGLVRQWLGDERFAESRLVFVTRGAVAGGDLAGAAVQGLVRSAQAEHPGRFRLIDSADERPLPPEALASDEPELLVRDGRPLVPRLARVEPSPDADPVEPGWADGGNGADHRGNRRAWRHPGAPPGDRAQGQRTAARLPPGAGRARGGRAGRRADHPRGRGGGGGPRRSRPGGGGRAHGRLRRPGDGGGACRRGAR